MTEPTTAPCYDRGCLHYDHEEPPCVGHMPSICCAKLSAAIGAAAVADYRSATPAPTVAQLAEAMRETGRQVFAGGESMPVAFYVPWARDILAALATPDVPGKCWYPGCTATDETHFACLGGAKCIGHHPAPSTPEPTR